MNRLYSYVGGDIDEQVVNAPPGKRISSKMDLEKWLRETDQEMDDEGRMWVTFVVDRKETLRVAPRRSEHVACAEGGPVLAAGEMAFDWNEDMVEVVEVTNQSTGYCPEPASWPMVASALDRIGIRHPGEYTVAMEFRRCPECRERNLVKDGWFVCGGCGEDLPEEWNFV